MAGRKKAEAEAPEPATDGAERYPRTGYATLPKFRVIDRLVDGMVRDPEKPGKMKPGKVVEKLMVPEDTDVTFEEYEDGTRMIVEPERLRGFPLPR